jgi:hypothetical protein
LIAPHCRIVQVRARLWDLCQLDRPQRAGDATEVIDLANLFVPKQLGPRAVR